MVTLYYYEDLNLNQIGATLNLKETRISQLHRKAIARLGRLSGSTDLNGQ